MYSVPPAVGPADAAAADGAEDAPAAAEAAAPEAAAPADAAGLLVAELPQAPTTSIAAKLRVKTRVRVLILTISLLQVAETPPAFTAWYRFATAPRTRRGDADE